MAVPVKSRSNRKKTLKTDVCVLSIIVPVFNEQDTVAEVLRRVVSQPLPGWNKEIIVVDDGSTDRTLQRLKPYLNRVWLIRHPRNLGRGMAIRSALAQASGDAMILQDADLEYNPTDWPRLLARLDDLQVRVVYGSRTIHPQESGYLLYVYGSRFLTFLINLIFQSQLTDLYTGCKLFRSSAVAGKSFTRSGFDFEIELTAHFLRQGLRIAEVPISYHPRSFAAGKKITPWDGLKGLGILISLGLSRRLRRFQ